MKLLYEGSVKNILSKSGLGDRAGTSSSVVFEYTDAFSVFDWGKMPDLLPHKGEALAVLAASLFEKLESDGLATHYHGVLRAEDLDHPMPVKKTDQPVRHLSVKQVSVVKPVFVEKSGHLVPDYTATKASPPPRLIPLEVVFRFSCPPGSSYLERSGVAQGTKWDFPVLEMFTKLEPSDRLLAKEEALDISGLSLKQLGEILNKTAWVASWLKALCDKKGLELADGKLEWGVNENGETFLVDAIGPDELRILKDGLQLSKEFLRGYYRKTPWYAAVTEAKKQKNPEWKKQISLPPPPLPLPYKETASQLYRCLTNLLTEHAWFPEAWTLEQVMEKMRGFPRCGLGWQRACLGMETLPVSQSHSGDCSSWKCRIFRN